MFVHKLRRGKDKHGMPHSLCKEQILYCAIDLWSWWWKNVTCGECLKKRLK